MTAVDGTNNDITVANRVSSWNRWRKWRLFIDAVSPTPATRVLDVGYQDAEYQPADNFIEKHYPWLSQVTALGVDPPSRFDARYPDVTTVHYDGLHFPFEDQSFDVVWSNAVLEHVGDRDRQLLFLREIRRVGKRAFVTTPNRRFPIEVHTRTPLLHYLPKPIFDSFLRATNRRWAADDYMWLLDVRELLVLLSEAGFDDPQVRRNRLGPFTLDFVVIA